MAEIQILPIRIGTEGAHRLLSALQDDVASGRDLGPRGLQIQALGHSLEQTSQELRRMMEGISFVSCTEDPSLNLARANLLRWRDDLIQLADAFARLGAVARAYPA